MEKKTILVLDDNSDIRNCLKKFLEKGDYNVIECDDADITAQKIRAGEIKYDAMVSDCCSFNSDSYSQNQAIMASKELYPDKPRIGISSHPQIDAECVHVHFPKPFQLSGLVEIIDNFFPK